MRIALYARVSKRDTENQLAQLREFAQVQRWTIIHEYVDRTSGKHSDREQFVPLSVDEVARFWSSFGTSRDLAIVGLMFLQGLRSAEVLHLNRDDLLLSEAQISVHGKGNKRRFLPWRPKPSSSSITTCAPRGAIPPRRPYSSP